MSWDKKLIKPYNIFFNIKSAERKIYGDQSTGRNLTNPIKYQNSYKCKYCKAQFPKACSLG